MLFQLNIVSYIYALQQGIVRALKEYKTKLIEYGVSIFVRRGGPNYQEGLRVMRELGKTTVSVTHYTGSESEFPRKIHSGTVSSRTLKEGEGDFRH